MPSLFAAYLRVYEPLTAFDRERQVYWRRYVKEGRAVAPAEGPVRQRTAVLEALGAGWTRLPDLPDEAYVLETDDTVLICPWNLRFRVAEAALTARDGVPSIIADAFVPPVLAGQAKAIVDDWRSGPRVLERGMPRVHEQIATWGVPLRWFVFVDLDERELSFRPGRRRCGTGRRSPARAAARTGPVRSCASRSATPRSPPRWKRVPGGSRIFTPVRCSNWTTAGSSSCFVTMRCVRMIHPDWSRPGSPGSPPGIRTRRPRHTKSLLAGGGPYSYSNGPTNYKSHAANVKIPRY